MYIGKGAVVIAASASFGEIELASMDTLARGVPGVRACGDRRLWSQ